MAANISRTGLITRPISSDWGESPRTAPIKNAPAAADSPSCCPANASTKHKARPVISSVSSDLNRLMKFNNRGAKSAPKPRAPRPKIASFPTRRPTSDGLAAPEEATPASTVSITTAMKSSTTRTPTMSLPRVSCRLPVSLSIFIRMAELLMEMLTPRNMPSRLPQPSHSATW